MAKQERLQSIVEPYAYFRQAEAFALTALAARAKRNEVGDDAAILLLPQTVCSAFAVEMYLKCWSVIEGRQPLRTHDLRDLYNDIQDVEAKRLIKLIFEAQNGASFANWKLNGPDPSKVPKDFEEALVFSSTAFVKIRYHMEYDGSVGYWLSSLPSLLRMTLVGKVPEWNGDPEALYGP